MLCSRLVPRKLVLGHETRVLTARKMVVDDSRSSRSNPSMDFRRRGKIAAIQARLEICETERRQLLRVVTTTGANLAQISDRVNRVQSELRRLNNELKVLEMAEREERTS